MAFIRRATKGDVIELSPYLRPEDVEECRILAGADPLTALLSGYDKSDECFTFCTEDGTPVGMYGVVGTPKPPHPAAVGLIWMLISDAALDPRVALSLLRQGPAQLEEISKPYNYVWNWVPARADKTNKWLTHLGFRAHMQAEYSGVTFNLMLRKTPCVLP